MRKMVLNKLFLLLLLLPAGLIAQDITGLWKGEMYVDSTKKYLPYEISISEVKGKLVGYSLITFEENGKLENGTRDISIERNNNDIVIEDVSLIDNSFSYVPPKKIKKTMVVTLSVQDTTMFLIGNWSTNRTKHLFSATGTVKLQRHYDLKSSGLYKKLEQLKLTDKLAFNKPEIPAQTAKIIPVKAPDVETPVVLTNPDVKKPVPVVEPPPTVAAITPPVIIKKPVPVVVKPVPPVVVAKPVEIKKPAPVITKRSPPVHEPKEVAVKNTAVKKPAPAIVKPALPIAVVAAPVVTKPKEVPVTVTERAAPAVLPSIEQGAADVNKRTISSTQSVFFESDSLVLTLYDNGYVDGDTVSVVMNGAIIFSKQGLSTRPVSKTIHITKDTPDSITLVMYAENLGSIPPNTGLLVVHDGESIYDVRFSADLSTNAAIILKRKKQDK